MWEVYKKFLMMVGVSVIFVFVLYSLWELIVKLLKNILSIFLLMFIFSCSGTGTKDLGFIYPQLDEKPNNKVFISNVAGWEGLTSNFQILLNGQSIGTLGRDEILIGEGKDGRNT